MKLDEILDQWQKDSQINPSNLADTSRLTPLLHSKYLTKLSTAKLLLKRAEAAQKVLLKQKWLYYNGKMDQQTMTDLGWDPDPFDGLKILKGEMDYYYDSDPEIQKSEEKIHYYKTTIDTLSDIVDSIKWRHQTIKNMIDWRKFESGS